MLPNIYVSPIFILVRLHLYCWLILHASDIGREKKSVKTINSIRKVDITIMICIVYLYSAGEGGV